MAVVPAAFVGAPSQVWVRVWAEDFELIPFSVALFPTPVPDPASV